MILRWLRYAVMILLSIEVALAVAYLLAPHSPLFDLDQEHNLPEWFSSMQLALLAVAMLAAHAVEDGASEQHPHRWTWLVLAAGSLALSADESVALHEHLLRDRVRLWLPADSLWQAVRAWQLVLAPPLAAGLVALVLVWHTRLRRCGRAGTLAFAGLAFWMVAIVGEALETPLFHPLGLDRLEVLVEEISEMLGATCWIAATTMYAAARADGTAPAIVRAAWGRVVATAGGTFAGVAAVIAVAIAHNPGAAARFAGNKLLKLGKPDRAVVAYRQAVAVVPDDATLWGELAHALDAAGDENGARAARNHAENLPPRHAAHTP